MRSVLSFFSTYLLPLIQLIILSFVAIRNWFHPTLLLILKQFSSTSAFFYLAYLYHLAFHSTQLFTQPLGPVIFKNSFKYHLWAIQRVDAICVLATVDAMGRNLDDIFYLYIHTLINTALIVESHLSNLVFGGIGRGKLG